MLMVIMHNSKDYLELLEGIFRKDEGIKDTAIIEKKDMGLRLVGGKTNVVFRKGSLLNAYNKAFVAVVKDEEDIPRILDRIETDSVLNALNSDDKGFICTVPLQSIKELQIRSGVAEKGSKIMKISQYLIPEHIIFDLKSKSKYEAIKELAEVFKIRKEINDSSLFLKHVFERESLASTGIGNGVAIPHARTDLVKDFVIAIGKSNSGIEFSSVDAKPVNIIFLMATPQEKGLNNYLKILARLSRLLSKESFRTELIKADSPQKIIDIFRKSEV